MLRKSVRAFVEKEVAPRVDEWEAAGQIPKSFWRRLGEVGFLGLEFPVEYGGAGGGFLLGGGVGEGVGGRRWGGGGVHGVVGHENVPPRGPRYGEDCPKREKQPRGHLGDDR